MTHYANLLAGRQRTSSQVRPHALFVLLDEEDDRVFNYERPRPIALGIGGYDRTPRRPRRLPSSDWAARGHMFSTSSPSRPCVRSGYLTKTYSFSTTPFELWCHSIEELREAPSGGSISGIYSKMHRRHHRKRKRRIDESNSTLLDGVTFAPLHGCKVKEGTDCSKLESSARAFIDVGMELRLEDRSCGILEDCKHARESERNVKERVSFDDARLRRIYKPNIQVADLNALNAVLLLSSWSFGGFYRDSASITALTPLTATCFER